MFKEKISQICPRGPTWCHCQTQTALENLENLRSGCLPPSSARKRSFMKISFFTKENSSQRFRVPTGNQLAMTSLSWSHQPRCSQFFRFPLLCSKKSTSHSPAISQIVLGICRMVGDHWMQPRSSSSCAIKAPTFHQCPVFVFTVSLSRSRDEVENAKLWLLKVTLWKSSGIGIPRDAKKTLEIHFHIIHRPSGLFRIFSRAP